MVSFRDHQSYLVLGALQSCTILSGGLLTAAFLKARESVGFDAWPHSRFIEATLYFVRFWGFSFLVFPVIWVIGSIWLERHHPELATRSRMILIGSLLFVGLIIMYYWMITAAISPPPMRIHA